MGFLIGMGLCLLWYPGKFAYDVRPRRKREGGFSTIYVEEDGSARELSADERKYLSTQFRPDDGVRPYIKFNYESLTPDERISGYLSRRQLPRHIAIQPATDEASGE